MRIVDIHNHIFPDDVAQDYVEDYFKLSGLPFLSEPTIGSLLECMRKNEVSRACVLQEWQTTAPFESENLVGMCSTDEYHFYSYHAWLSGVQERHPEVVCFGGVHPVEADPLASLEGMVAEHGLFGLKLVPCMQQYRLNDPRLMPVYKKAEEYGFPVIMHTGLDPIMGMEDYGHPRDAGEVAAVCPDLTIVMAHMGMPFYSETREVTSSCPNVYVDVAAAIELLDEKELSALIRDVGPDRVLFGSDFPFCDTTESLRRVEELDLSSGEKEMILGGNAARVLKI